MKLSKDIFKTILDYVGLLHYLHSEKAFTVDLICLKFNISKWVVYKQIRYWEEHGYISILATLGEKGGKQYTYQATAKLEQKLRDILALLLKDKDLV